MEKNIAHPTDARLYEKARAKLVDLAREGGLYLRQSYARKAPRLAVKIGRYAHARQFKRMRKALRTLKGYTGRILRDIRRQLDDIPAGAYRERVLDMLAPVSRPARTRRRRAAASSTPCTSPRSTAFPRARPGCATNSAPRSALPPPLARGSWWGCGLCPLPGRRLLAIAERGNPYDGHTLAEAIEQVDILTDQCPDLAVVDRGYRGYGVKRTQVLISGQRRGVTPSLKSLLRRRSAIEPSPLGSNHVWMAPAGQVYIAGDWRLVGCGHVYGV